jgi:RHS repeat-associated protein
MSLQRIKMYYDPRGQVIRTVNPDGSEQRVVYGVPAQLTQVGSYTPSPWETYTYDANDLDPLSPHYGTPKSARVDAMGRTVQTLDRLESSNSTEDNVQMRYQYDIRGNLLEVKDAYNREVFEHKYDLRPPAKEGEAVPPLWTRHINKGESHVVFDCTGKPVESRDTKGALALSEYDVLQRPVRVWCRDTASEAVGLRQLIAYGTNAANNSKGKPLQHNDESGIQYTPQYDYKGNPVYKVRQVISIAEVATAIIDSYNSGWMDMYCYRVDWDNTPATSGDYRTDMAYDALNRIMKITYPEDANNNRKELIPEYNRAGALKKVFFDGNEYVQNIGYNAKGQRLIIAYGNNLMTRYTYDEQTFRLKRLRTERYTYSSHVTPSGVEELYEYEAGTCKQDFAYRYDKAGNILNINDETPACGIGGDDELEKTFEYDALYRLLSATGRENQPNALYWNDSYRNDDVNTTTAYTQYYSYDLMGNISELQHIGDSNFTRTYNHSNNLLNDFEAGANRFYYEYDDCGNQIKENEERNFQWDYGDKLRLYYNQTAPGNEPSVYTHYLYDAAGNRVKKLTRTAGGNWETITYIDGIIEYRENDASEYQSISHVMDASTGSAQSKRIATIREGDDFDDPTPAIKYNLDDHLGSSNVLVDENGTLVNREEYYPFGETSFGSYAKKRYRFCGKEKDEESGLYYYGARYYAPWLCRFVSVDPLAGDYPFYTPFQYAGNQPINFIDLDGKEPAPAQSDSTGTNSSSTAQPADSSGVQQQPAANDTAGTNINCHIVQSGETLGGIAKKYGTTVVNIKADNKQLNDQKDTDLAVGTELNILPHAKPMNSPQESYTSPMLKDSPLKTMEMMIDSKWKPGNTTSSNSGNTAQGQNSNAPTNSSQQTKSYSSESKKTYSIDKAVTYIMNNKLPGFGKGRCSPYTPRAINAGFGSDVVPTDLAGSAYGPSLLKAGFIALDIGIKNLADYTPIKGDIIVMNGPPGGKTCNTGIGGPCGHIQMFNGTEWVSDFLQTRPFWPGKDYAKHKPAFKIYRWGGTNP